MLHMLNYSLPNSIISEILSKFVSLKEISILDVAFCYKEKRPLYLECVGSDHCIWNGEKGLNFKSQGILWLATRCIKIRHLTCSQVNCDMAAKINGFGIYIIFKHICRK
jgi:hypothetical protein